MIHLYALVEGPTVTGDLAGVDGRAVTELAGPLRAVISEHPEPPRATTERALAHARVVATVCEAGHALPVRYGAHHADATALRSALAARAEELTAALDQVGGHLEVAVRGATPPEPSPSAAPDAAATAPDAATTAPDAATTAPNAATTAPDAATTAPNAATTHPVAPSAPAAPGTGRAYLEARRAEERAAREVQADAVTRLRRCTRTLEPLAAAVTEHTGPRGPERCLLVPRGRLAEVLEAAAAIEAADGVVVTGPWPPYTFARARTA